MIRGSPSTKAARQCFNIDRNSPNSRTDDNFLLNTPIRCYNSGPLWTYQNTFTNEFFMSTICTNISHPLINLIPGWGQTAFFEITISRDGVWDLRK